MRFMQYRRCYMQYGHSLRAAAAAALFFFITLLSNGASVLADEQAMVKLPLQTYDALIEDARARWNERPVPPNYLLGAADVRAVIDESTSPPSATVTVDLDISVMDGGITTVPLFPAGLPLVSAKMNDFPAKLNSTPAGISYTASQSGSF